MELKKGYKKTELGIIPEDWDIKKMGELGDVKMCRRIFSSETKSLGDIPFYKIGTFGKEPDSFIAINLYNSYRKKFPFPKKGDILISAAGTIGRTVRYDGSPAYFQDSNIVWIDNNEEIVSNNYLEYIFEIVKYETEGGTIQRLYNSILQNTMFSAPHLPEQNAIATALSDMDVLIAQTEKLIEKKIAIKQGMMQQLLSPYDAEGKLKEGWGKKKLEEVADIVGGGTPSTMNLSYWNGDVNWFTPTEVGFSKYLFESVRKITSEGFRMSSARILPAGTVLFTSRASLGDVAILKNEGCTNQGFQSFVAKNGTSNEFLYYLLLNMKLVFFQYASGSTFLEISPGKLKSIEVIIPDDQQQNMIAKVLSEMDTELDIHEMRLKKQKLLKQAMMQSLLTGKIRIHKPKHESANQD